MIGRSKLAERISEELETDQRTADAAISVVDDNGLITLKGRVETYDVRDAAEAITASTEGVVEVVNDLEVEEIHEAPDEGDGDKEEVDLEPVFFDDLEDDEDDDSDVDVVAAAPAPTAP